MKPRIWAIEILQTVLANRCCCNSACNCANSDSEPSFSGPSGCGAVVRVSARTLEELLARCQAGEPISRKLIDEVGGKAPKSSDSVNVFSVAVKREFMSQWRADDRSRFFKLIADLKLRCDTEAPYGVSSNENLDKLRPKK